MERLLLVALGGAIGSVFRYVTSGLAMAWVGVEFPYGTLIVNVAGSFLIGIVQTLALDSPVLSEPTRLFLAVGVMGGFTTYSAFSYESVRLMQLGAWGAVFANVLVTTLVCLGVCALGIATGRVLLTLRG